MTIAAIAPPDKEVGDGWINAVGEAVGEKVEGETVGSMLTEGNAVGTNAELPE